MQKRVKKAFIIINHFKIGGAERVASILANVMSDEWEVHALVSDPTMNYPVDERVKIHTVETKRNSLPLRFLARVNKFRKLCREIKPDVIFSFGYSSSVYGWQCKRVLRNKTIFVASERTDPTKEPKNRISVLLRNISYKNADYLVCQTQWVKSFFENNGINQHCVVIPNPVSPNLPEWRGENSKVIITAARLEPQKNLPLLIRAFACFLKNHPEYTLKIFGEGYLRTELETLIKDLGLGNSVSLPGFSKDIMNEMAISRMYVSTSDYEGISNSMLEAIAIGVPIVHTDCPVGGAAMYIKNGTNGFLVPVGDQMAVESAMHQIVNGALDFNSLKISAMSLRNNLSPDKIASSWAYLAK